MQYIRVCSMFYLMLIMLAGCNKPKSVPFFYQRHTVERHDMEALKLEAHLHDIAIPFHQSRPVLLSTPSQAPETIILEYTLMQDDQAIINFIGQEMDRLGWQSLMSVSGQEGLMVYKKPKKRAAFYLSLYPEYVRLVIFVCQDQILSVS